MDQSEVISILRDSNNLNSLQTDKLDLPSTSNHGIKNRNLCPSGSSLMSTSVDILSYGSDSNSNLSTVNLPNDKIDTSNTGFRNQNEDEYLNSLRLKYLGKECSIKTSDTSMIVTNVDKATKQFVHTLSDSEESGSDDHLISQECAGNFNSDESCSSRTTEVDHQKLEDESKSVSTKRVRQRVTSEERNEKIAEKMRKKVERDLERAEKKEKLERDKALKRAVSQAKRANKPGESLKYVKALLDTNLLTTSFGGELLVCLQNMQLQYSIESHIVSSIITWTREVPRYNMNDDLVLAVDNEISEEDKALLIWSWQDTFEAVTNNELIPKILSLQELINKKITLVIFGSKEYFKDKKLAKSREMKSRISNSQSQRSRKSAASAFRNMSKANFEMALSELQILTGCSSMLIDSPTDLGNYVAQFTKSVVEAPYKKEKKEKDLARVGWFATADSRNCIKVDKNANGLIRLWRQQLCQFNSVSIEVAEAISLVYQSPSALIKAYEKCISLQEKEKLLQDIQIRRNVGPLSSVRRIGMELSRKICTYFNTIEGDTPLSQE